MVIGIGTAIFALILGIGGIWAWWTTVQFMTAVIQILSVVIVIIAAPFLIKFITDVILYTGLKLSKTVSLFLGIIGSVPILVILYMNLPALIMFAILMGVIYAIARFYGIGKFGRNLMSFTKWFEKRGKK